MGRWEITLTAPERQADTPLFLQIARAVADDVQRGRLRPGAPLPGTRTLARDLGVHRNTALAAYAELAAEGWITTSPARGSFVSVELPDAEPRRFGAARPGVASRPGFDLPPEALAVPEAPAAPGALELASVPDVRLIPGAELARAYRRALRTQGRAVFGYGDARGHPRLRAALAAMLSAARGLAGGEDRLIATAGSQQALYLAARALVSPGDVVAVEALGYRPAWQAFWAAGARLVPIPLDGAGLRADRLAELAARERVRALYVTPHHQYPTTVSLAPGRRLELLALARDRRFAVVEDDYDHEFHFEGRPLLPLASADADGVVVYVGTLSKVLAPAIRIGYLAAPEAVLARVAAHRMCVDRQGDPAVQAAVAELLEDGIVQRHVRRVRRAYRARRDALVEALHARLGGAVEVRVPAGGMALWARVAPDLDVDAWSAAARARGVVFPTAQRFAFDGRPRPYARLGYAALTEGEIAEAVRRLAAALPDARRTRARRAAP
jgi:GntR family transcriptional regulator/MocR family aminotransferase